MSSHHRAEAQVATVRVPSLATSWDKSNARGETAHFPPEQVAGSFGRSPAAPRACLGWSPDANRPAGPLGSFLANSCSEVKSGLKFAS